MVDNTTHLASVGLAQAHPNYSTYGIEAIWCSIRLFICLNYGPDHPQLKRHTRMPCHACALRVIRVAYWYYVYLHTHVYLVWHTGAHAVFTHAHKAFTHVRVCIRSYK